MARRMTRAMTRAMWAKKRLFPHLHKGQRRGQTLTRFQVDGGSYYLKGGKLHKSDRTRDYKRKSKRTRKAKEPRWRGDLPGERL